MTRRTAPAFSRQSPLPRLRVPPVGAQCSRQLPVAQRALLVPSPAQQPRSSASVPPSFVLPFLLSLLYPASCFSSTFHQPGSPARLVLPAPLPHQNTPGGTLQTPPQEALPVHTTRAKATGRGRRGRRAPQVLQSRKPRYPAAAARRAGVGGAWAQAGLAARLGSGCPQPGARVPRAGERVGRRMGSGLPPAGGRPC